MIKHIAVYGVDISKDVFDVVDSKGVHNQFANTTSGFKQFKKTLPKNSLVVMEATGYYHYCLAQFLVAKKIKVSVVNPLSVKRFRQMKFSKVKNDKADAGMICEYAINNSVPPYVLKNKNQAECDQLFSLADLYQKQRTALQNKLQGEISLGKPSKKTIFSIKRLLRTLLREMLELEERLEKLIQENHPNQVQLLKSIPGIGTKTSNYLILLTNGFKKFEDSRQLCSYTGLTPTTRQSGSSIRGRSRISKMGNPKIRNLLFLCSFSACKYNASCRALFDRIVAKGKSRKLALVAVCNKLLKQAFAIVKSNTPYSTTYYQPVSKPEMPAQCLELG